MRKLALAIATTRPPPTADGSQRGDRRDPLKEIEMLKLRNKALWGPCVPLVPRSNPSAMMARTAPGIAAKTLGESNCGRQSQRLRSSVILGARRPALDRPAARPPNDQPQQPITCDLSHLPHCEQQSLQQHPPAHSLAQHVPGSGFAPASLALDRAPREAATVNAPRTPSSRRRIIAFLPFNVNA